MSITTRHAQASDNARLHEIFRAAFGKEDESELWSYLLDHALVEPGNTLLALDESGRPMAVTVIQRRSMRTRYGWAPGAIVTLVGTDPTVQRQGYGAAAVRAAQARMKAEGLAVGILYGVAEYYPKFGFVPVLPGYRTEVTTAALRGYGEATLRAATADDFPALATLYAGAYADYPCAIQRDASAPLWGVRVPELNSLLTLPDQQGYAFIRRNPEFLYVYEAAAADAEAGRRLLAALGNQATGGGLEKVVFGLPPEHLLIRLLRLGESRQTWGAAKFGMAYVADWAPVLAPGYAVSDEGLLFEGRLAVRADRTVVTQLVLGYRSLADLRLMAGVEVLGDEARLAADFPPTFPKWSLDPFWEGA